MLGLPSLAHAQDQDRYWDANGTGTGSGGNGNWNTTDPVWSESNSDVLGPYRTWDNAALDNAIFGVTAGGTTTTVGTVTLTEPITVHNMTFQRVNGWVVNGGTLTLAGTTPTINTLANTTINSVIAGNSGLTKTGGSQLFLTGVNTFSGGITLSGSLRAANDAALGNASNGITTIANASFTLDTGSTARTVAIGGGTTLTISGAGAGSALYTGSGNISVLSGVTLSNDANTYTGTTRLNGVSQGSGTVRFTSVRNLGEASSLGAPTTVAEGTITFAGGSQYADNIVYIGDGDTSNRNWVLQGGPARVFRQRGTGTLTLTGDISVTPTSFIAETADFELLGVISGSGNVGFGASAAGSITLGGANTFTGNAGVSGGIVRAPVLADAGLASSLGTAPTISLGNLGQLSYTGIGGGSNRTWSSDGATAILNDGTGALTLSGNLAFVTGGTDTLTLGGSFAGTSTFSGIISGNGNLASSGNGTWVLDGVNTRTGTVTMNGGTLRAGNASALGTTTSVTINAGTLDLNGFDLTTTALNGTGGTLALGSAFLTLNTTAANNFAGAITGTGGLTKLGTGTLTLSGASTYSGDTNIQGGTLALNFAPAGGPAGDIIGASSTLNMSGGTLSITGAAGEANTQTFDGLNITIGANTISGTSGSGGSLNVNFGAITRTGGIVNFNLPTSGNFTTSNASLGGWATVNGTDYAKVVGGNILAFTDADYVDKDDVSTWADGEFISDSDGDADSYFGTVGSSIQLGGLQFTTPDATTTVTIADGQTLGVDGTIIIAPSVVANNQTITGGNLTGLSGAGGVLGVLHNGTGTLTVASTVVDNGGATGFTKGGQGTVSLTGANSYTGATMLSNGRLIVNSIGDGGAASAIGASSAAPVSLVIEGGILQYAGDTVTTDRGFTLVNGGLSRTIEIASGAANLTFTGLITSPDDAGLIKAGGGTLTLANAANDYVGVTRIENGILSVGTLADGGQVSGIGAATSDSTNLVLLNGGTLQYTGGSVDIDRGFTIESGAGRIDVSSTATELTVGGAIVGAGRLEKYGDGTLVLTGTSTYTGITVVNAGTLRAGAALAGGSTTGVFGTISSAMTVNAGATLDLADNSNQIGALNGGGNVTLGALAGTTLTIGGANSGSPGFTGTISGAGNVTHTNGTQVMTGCGNSYEGITTITGAFGGSVLSTDCIQNGGVNSGIGASDSAPGSLVLQNSGILNYTAVGTNQTTDRGFTLGAGFGYIQVNDPGTTLEFTSTIVGPGSLIKRGAGTLILSGVNSSTGETRVEGGILRAGSATAFGTGSAVLSNVAGAVLDLNGYNMSASVLSGGGAAGGNVQLGSGTLAVGGANGTYAGLITGTGGFVKTGGGTQYLSGCSSNYTGGTSVTGGILQVQCLTNGGTNSSIGASSSAASNLVVNNGALTYLGTGSSTDRLMTIGGTAQILSSGTGAVDFTNTGAIVFANPNTAQTIRLGGTYLGDNRFGLRLDNNGAGVTSFIKQDAGTWILTNSGSSYTGTTQVLGGVLGVDKLSNGGLGSSLGASSNAASNLTIGSGATLRYTGAGDSTDRRFTLAVGTTFIESSGTGAVNFTNTGTVSYTGNGARVMALGGTNAGDNIMGATIGNQGANVTSLAKNDSGQWILTGTNTYTGLTNINAGTLIIGNGGTNGSIVSSTINNAGVLGFNRSDTLGIAGDIQGAGTVQQLGTGTTVLTGTSTYTGGTTIAQGRLQLGNGGTTGSIVGDVVNNGTLTFNRNNGYTFGGTISGTGAVGQIGTGTTTLTGTNSYQGGTNISAGTFQVSSDANLGAASGGLTFNGGTLNTTASFTSSRATNLSVAGTFSTNTGTTLALTGTVSGAGALRKSGAGTLVLTADNSYAGGTTISAGTLQIGDGGATGSIAGNVLNNGALVLNRSGVLTFGGTIIGGGSVTQAGPGTTILTGANTYAGATNVNAGTLLVNGDQSGATNLVTVASGATLGGTGTIGGDVTVADGATLTAGSGGVGILTINGSLSLAGTSQLAFEFGQANAPGSPLNDVINVGGDLTLDGEIDIAVSSGGSFDIGLYRVINYGGTLTDGGLDIGALPAGVDPNDVFVQTAIAGQVNLINANGVTLNFWDGAAGPKFDGSVNGGSGIWQNSTGNDNWTDPSGAVNAPFTDSAIAIFSAAPGAVTVDNSLGAVSAGGMQFASDGYLITGDAVTLANPQSVIRVGDGTGAGAGYTATINSVLAGAAQLVKTDLGTLVLSGANTYTGGTLIDAGTLSISSDANLGDATGVLSLDGAALNTTADIASGRIVDLLGDGTFLTDVGTALTLNGAVVGGGALIKDGGGTLILAAANSYLGGTTITTGTLQIGDGGTTGSIDGDVFNDGALAFNRSDAVTFAGLISGSGSLIQDGSGLLTLTANNSFTGLTTIASGRLRLGAAGTSGGVAGDILNNGELLFDRTDTVAFAGLILGSGLVQHIGSGTTILTGSNSYAGTTTVNNGTLLINGDQSAAVGDTSVNNFATLGGVGTVGGRVIVGSATLAPGDASGPGTLTINGDLVLSNAAQLDYQFGQSNIIGGPLNDLTEVGGDLVLDGTINVTVSPGGSFDVGVYRVISYSGTLTDNGLDIGADPSGGTVSVQTSVANQVNLVNTAGLTLNFWDGAAGPKFDGAVNGGDGVWQNSTGNDNWTEETGGLNAAFADAAFAIFSAAPGTVEVDNDLGQVSASGMQFASDGYVITGDTLNLVGPQSVIRVGDGTADGGAFVATIATGMTGAGDLVKTDLGTLVLTGDSTIAGYVYVNAGELRLADGGTLGSANASIGPNSGNQAIVTVTGADGSGNASTWAVGGDLEVGYDGTGTLNIADGGRATSNIGYIGRGTDGIGSVRVTGAGSTWENTGRIIVGDSGTGSLRIEDGAVVSSQDGQVGASGQGDVVVSGAGTSWTNAEQLTVGSFGAGTMRIENGASVTSNQGFVGANADGSVVVTGTGSNWLVTTLNMTVGNDGTGALTIADGGRVRAEGGFLLGNTAASGGTVSVLGTTGSRGVLETGRIGAGLGVIDFSLDGGVLRATQDADDFFVGFDTHDLTLGAGGGIVDTDGNDIGISPRFVGAGGLTKDGVGTLRLTGANSYAGATFVNAGTLLVGGDQSAATGLTTVLSGATLGGTGTIGGDVEVLDGAGLAPGDSVGTLTINGNLSLSGGSILTYEFGQANVAGGALNDLVNVGGDLVLDGTIDVSVPAGGSFGPGVYRVFNYGGALIDNGLGLGLLPAGSDVAVQTSIAGQVNLVNAAGLALTFWDGDAGPKNDGVINGGDGVWRLAGGSNNWTDSVGGLNASYAQDGFAVFAGAAGTVTVDDVGGAVGASGMQFASDGYVISGDAITLADPQSVIRVGDGSVAGAGITATIASELTGSARLVKTDAGTLVLTAANSYAGGTAIDGGTLRIVSDANLGEVSGGVSLNGGTLNTTADLVSARAFNLGGPGAILTDAATTLTLTGTLSGVGALIKSGTGTLVLGGTGNSTGTTSVNAGTLLVNGDYAGATGAMSVAGGARLGGTGSIGGDVTLADNAILTPGTSAPGTLTINGDLSLASGARLDFEFGQANVAGGALNDLVNVGGDLALDGTIDVAVPAGGGFGVGVYRVFNYGGTLTDNGLSLGLLPPGSEVTVQTSIAGQVNLVNAAGANLTFWDGAAGPKNNGVVNGGTGIWQNSAGNDNWTESTGTVNAAYDDASFAIFAGTGGTVTVDDSLGDVISGGMQFAVGDYRVTGDNISLAGPQTTIRVGDGTGAGAGMTATVDAVLQGTTQLIKTDAGTVVLGGANTYTGGTLISGGTIQLAADANLGALDGAVTLNGGTLCTSASLSSSRDLIMTGNGTISTASATTFTYDGLISGTGTLTKAGGGILLLSGDNGAYTGDANVAGGTLTVLGILGGTVNVNEGARLEGTGQVGSLINSGLVAPGRDGFGTLTIAGRYAGQGGTLEIETELGGDNSQTDRLVIGGGTSGSTAISIVNRGGLGAQTIEGIKIVDVTGDASAGTFTLRGDYNFEGSPAVIAGAYGYRLFQGGVSTPTDGDWYLRSALLDAPNEPQVPLYQPGVPLYESYAQTLQTLNGLSTLQERVGNRQWSGFTQSGIGMWGRIEASRHRPEAAFSTSGSDLDVNDWSLQTGFDAALHDSNAGTLIAGVNARYGKADARVRSRFGNGDIDTQGYGVGATLTWYSAGGFYADAQAQLSWYRSDLISDVLGELIDNNHGSGEAFSLEVGKRASLGGRLSVTPQIQMVYSNVRFDRFTDPSDATVSAQRADSLRSRWGISLDHQRSWGAAGDARRSHIYAIANLHYEWLDGGIVDVSATSLARRDDRLRGELGIGGSYSWNDGHYTIFSEASAATAINGFGDSNTLRANAGFRMRF